MTERFYMETTPFEIGESFFHGVRYRILDREKPGWHNIYPAWHRAKAIRRLERLNKDEAK